MFLNHTELLPEDETVEEHAAGREAEARALAADRAGPGLFKGLFYMRRLPIFEPITPIVDAEDGVRRCPLCAWELEDGECGHCGWNPEEDSDDESLEPAEMQSYISDDDDRDISPVEEFGGILPFAVPHHVYGHHFHDHSEAGDISEGYDEDDVSARAYSVVDSDDPDNSDDDEMNSFIDDDNEDDADLP
jgi:hypothetical protein